MPSPLALNNKFRVGQVSYNGFVFPPAIHSSCKFTPVMDDSNRLMKYMRVDLRIECYLFNGADYPGSNVLTDEYADPLASPNNASNPNSGSDAIANASNITTDETMRIARNELLEPGGHLIFTYQGSGNLQINGTSGPKDVDNGPKPKIISWTPITNKMAKVVWEVSACFSPCANTTSGVTPSEIAQFPYSVNFEINENGLSVRTLTGVLEMARSMSEQSGTSTPYDTIEMQKQITQIFPMIPQFKRRQSYNLSEDRKSLRFSITDTEINSDEAYGPGCIQQDVTLSATASLQDGGFGKWRVALDGSITVAPGWEKRWAYTEISRIFQKIFVKNSVLGHRLRANSVEQAPGGYYDDSDPDSFPILQSMRYSDELFGRTVSFGFEWGLYCRPLELFKATGLFKPIRNSFGAQVDAWGLWTTSISQLVDNGGYQQMKVTEADDIVVSLCQPLTIGSTSRGTVEPPIEVPGGEQEPETDTRDVDAGNSYSRVETKFEVEVDNGTVEHVPLGDESPTNPEVYESTVEDLDFMWRRLGPYSTPPSSGVSTDPLPASTSKKIMHKTRPSTHTLVFSGYMERLCYPPPIPEVHTYLGVPVYKIGKDYIKHCTLGLGIDLNTGKNYSRHGLYWEQRYALPNPPSSSIIRSDGHPELYGVGPGATA